MSSVQHHPILGKPEGLGRFDTKLLLLIIATAIAVRCFYLRSYLQSPLFDYYLADQLYYRDWAIRIMEGDWSGTGVFEQGPLYAYLLGVAFKLFGTSLTPVLILQLLSGTCTVILIWHCTRCLAGNRAAQAAGLLAAIYGPFVFYECMAMKSFLEPLLVMLTLAAHLKATSTKQLRWYGFSGLTLGLACLVREAHIILLLPLALNSLRLFSAENVVPIKRTLPALVMLLLFALILTPTTLHNWSAESTFVPVTSGGGEVLYMSFGASADGYCTYPYFAKPHPFDEHQDFRREAYFRTHSTVNRKESSSFWYRETLKEITASPERLIPLILKKTLILFSNAEIPDSSNYRVAVDLIPPLAFLPTFGWISGLGFLGGAILWRRRGQGRIAVFLTAFLVLEVLLTYNFGRFRLALCAVWLLLAGVGIDWLGQGVRKGGQKSCKRLVALVVVVALTATTLWAPIDRPSSPQAEMDSAYRGDVNEAARHRATIPALQAEVAQKPNSPDPLYYLGVAYWGTGKTQEAINAYEGVLKIQPNDPDTLRNLANIYRSYGRLEKASAYAETLTRLMPQDYYGYMLSGILALDMGSVTADPDTSRQYFQKAIDMLQNAEALQPGSAELHHYLGRAWHFIGEPHNAVQELSKALDINPDLQQARHDRNFITQKLK